jgi:hypothetical protein
MHSLPSVEIKFISQKHSKVSSIVSMGYRALINFKFLGQFVRFS